LRIESSIARRAGSVKIASSAGPASHNRTPLRKEVMGMFDFDDDGFWDLETEDLTFIEPLSLVIGLGRGAFFVFVERS